MLIKRASRAVLSRITSLKTGNPFLYFKQCPQQERCTPYTKSSSHLSNSQTTWWTNTSPIISAAQNRKYHYLFGLSSILGTILLIQEESRCEEIEQQTVDDAINLLKQGYQTPENYENQVQGFYQLGEFYRKQGNFKHAAALYTYALSIATDPEKNCYFSEQPLIYQEACKKELINIERLYLETVGSEKLPDSWQQHEARRNVLRQLRDRLSNDILDPSIPVKDLYKDASVCLRNFVKKIFDECRKKIPCSQSHCDFAIICYGSSARDEATPYSDLEFSILLKEEDVTDEHRKYFRRLCHLAHLYILFLAETTPRMQHVKDLAELDLLGRYSNSPVKRGFSFDGQNESGCVTPLGNVHLDLDESDTYELIGTPSEIASYYERDRHFSTAIRTACLIDGSEELFSAYQTQIENFHKEDRQRRALRLIEASVFEHEPHMGHRSKEGHLFSAKYDWYRIVNMFVDHLALYYDVKANNTWERIEVLIGKCFTVEDACRLKNVFSRIQKLRLKEYLSEDNQHNITRSSGIFNRKQTSSITNILGIEEQEVFEIYATLLPFYDSVAKFAVTQVFPELDRFSREYTTGRVHEQLSNYKDAIIHYQEALRIDPKDNDARYHLGLCYFNDQNFNKAEDPFRELLCSSDSSSDEDRYTTFYYLINLARVYQSLDTAEGFKSSQDCITQCQKILDGEADTSIHKLKLLNALGLFYRETSQLDQAEAILSEALKFLRENSDYAEWLLAHILNDLALSLMDKGGGANLSAALTHIDEAIGISVKLYGEQHPKMAIPLNTKSAVLCRQKQLQSCLDIRQDIYNIVRDNYGPHDFQLCEYANNLGQVYMRMEDFRNALQILGQARKLCIDNINARGLDRSEDIKLAIIEYNIACSHRGEGKLDAALVVFLEKLPLFIRAHGEASKYVIKIYEDISDAFLRKAKNETVLNQKHYQYFAEEAVKYAKKALSACIIVYGENGEKTKINSVYLAKLLWENMNKPDEAIPYFQQALEILHKNENYGPNHSETIELQTALANCIESIESESDLKGMPRMG